MPKPNTDRRAIRNKLLSNGYRPLPLADKGIYIKGWSREDITKDWLAQFARIGRYPNTGLRCDDLLAFDIDVLDEQLADECEDYVEQHAGPTDLCRVGRWPKRLILYRLDGEPVRSGRTGNYGGHMCELLTSHGRQFAAYGTHPGTGEPYAWEDASPEDTPFDELPVIEGEKALEILNGLDALLAATGLEKIRPAHLRNTVGDVEYDLQPDTEVMVAGEIVKWGEIKDQLSTDGEFGNLYRADAKAWGDSSAVHFFMTHGSREPCAHDFINDCTHYSALWDERFGQLLPKPPKKASDNQFVPKDMQDMVDNCVILRDKTVRRIDSPMRAYPLDGFVRSMQHIRVADPNPPRSNPNKTIPFTKIWEADPATHRADYAALRPDHADVTLIEQGNETILNTYCPPQHAGSGEIKTFAEFLAHLLPRPGEAEIFMQWLAHKVQHPGHRMHGMVMVTPAYGTGRGTLVQIMQRLFGITYVNEVELKDLLGQGGQGQFNAFLADSLVVTVAEALEEREDSTKWAARHVAYERLKIVCDPVAGHAHVRRKYGRNSTEQIYATLFVSSNHPDALAIEPGDRRLIVLSNTEVPLVDAPDALYERIQGWKDHGGNIAALHAGLARMPLTYDAFGEPPMTPAKAAMIEAGQSDTDRLFEYFAEQAAGAIATPAQWRQFAHRSAIQYELDLPADPHRRDLALTAVLQKRARRIETLPKTGIKVKGRPVRPWVIRDFSDWTGSADNDAIRAEILRNGDPGGAVLELPSG